MLESSPPRAENGTLFGDNIFSKIIKLKWIGLGGPSSIMTGIFMKRGKLDAETDMYMGECHVKIAVILPQAKEPPGARREAWIISVASTFRGSTALRTPSSQTSSLQDSEIRSCFHWSNQFVVFCYGSPRKLMHSVAQLLRTHWTCSFFSSPSLYFLISR